MSRGLLGVLGFGTSFLRKRVVMSCQRLAQFVLQHGDLRAVRFHNLEIFKVFGGLSRGVAQHSCEFRVATHDYWRGLCWPGLPITYAVVELRRGPVEHPPDRRCWSGVFRLVLGDTRLGTSDSACDVPPVTVAQLEKFEARAKGRSVTHDRNDANRSLGERKIHLYRLAYLQIALHKRSKTALAYIQADGVKRVWRRPRQLPQFQRYAE